MADALSQAHSLSSHIAPDPEVQALVNDFIDYTEFFPSDVIRSLTLIGKLDESYLDATANVHNLTSTYGVLPSLPSSQRPDAQTLRKKISNALDYAIHCRESAFAEAYRLYSVTERHCARIGNVKRKLQQLPLPPAPQTSPVNAGGQAQLSRARRTALDREHKSRITLHLESTRPGRRQLHSAEQQKDRNKVKVIDSDVRYDDGDSNAEENPPNAAPGSEESQMGTSETSEDTQDDLQDNDITTSNKMKSTKIRIPKIPKGQSANSYDILDAEALAAISTSNILANLEPPPADAKPGSRHAPWYKLTEWEMARLRKRMKKNAIWNPSDTMVRRELSDAGRGRENYEKAKTYAQATGEPFLDEDPIDPTKTVLGPGEISFSPLSKEDMQLVNRGMRLNEAKKLKKETLAREQAARDAMEIEEANKRIADAGHSMRNLFARPTRLQSSNVHSAGLDRGRSLVKTANKRKREGSVDGFGNLRDHLTSPTENGNGMAPKRLKIAPPRPLSFSGASGKARGLTALSSTGTTIKVPLAPADLSVGNGVDASGRRATVHHISLSDGTKKLLPSTTAATTRPRRASGFSKAVTPELATPSFRSTTSRPRSSGGSHTAGAKAASAEPLGKGEARNLRGLRRGSNVSLPTSPRSENQKNNMRRGKKAAPGLITAGEDGGTKVSVGKRKAAPKKRGSVAGKRRSDKDGDSSERIDSGEAGEDIDPNEETYCYCGDVSYGTMIACEADDVCYFILCFSNNLLEVPSANCIQCELEWFHIACVGLSEAPPRRSKWWCPDCRKRLGMDDKGNPVESVGRRR